jgi:small-conductance mechanosensitive channel
LKKQAEGCTISVMQKILEIITLHAFQVSLKRKAIFFFEIVVFGVLVYILRNGLLVYYPHIQNMLMLLMVYVCTRFVLEVIQISILSAYRARTKLEKEKKDNFTIGVNSLVSVLSLIAVVVGYFVVYDVEIRAALTSMSLFAVAIVLISKDYINNFIDGFILMFSGDFRVGEYIKIDDGPKALVQNITFRSTQLKSNEGNIFYVSNSKLLASDVTNFSKSRPKKILVPFTTNRSVLHDIASYEKKLITLVENVFSERIVKDKTYLRIIDIQNDEISVSLEIVVVSYSFDLEEQVKKCVYAQVLGWAKK